MAERLSTADFLEKYRRTVAEPLPVLSDYDERGRVVAFTAYQQAVIELLERLAEVQDERDQAINEARRLATAPSEHQEER